MKKRGSWFRRMILNYVDSWFEGVSIFLMILVIIATWSLCSSGEVGWGITTLCLGFLIVALVSWGFFCVIDVRESLRMIAENTSKECEADK